MNTIETLELTKRFGRVLAVDGVSLTLADGLIYGLLGANGSGKSTLLRVIATLERPTSGRVRVYGHDIAVAARAARRLIGFVPEEPGFDDGLRVAELLDYHATCRGLSRRERLAAVDTMLQLLDLDSLRNESAVALSRGLRQRLAIATAMLPNPPVLLLDEPFLGLDVAGRGEMVEMLKELRAMGKTIVVASHSVDEISRLCDEVGLLHRGRLVAFGAIGEVLGLELARSGGETAGWEDALARTFRGFAP